MFVDLKQGNLEKILTDCGINEEEVNSVRTDAQYYDKYILILSGKKIGFIKIWRQHISDPYMDIELDECDLVGFKNQGISSEEFIDVLDTIFELPQLLRCTENDYQIFRRRGFENIPDKLQKVSKSGLSASVLVAIVKKIDKQSEVNIGGFENVRPMDLKDLIFIEDTFFREYAVRFRAIRPMYHYDPKSCFVYDDGEIKGVLFGEEHEDDLYIHQIFVKEGCRGKRMDSVLLNFAQQYAIKLGKSAITGTIRGNLVTYYQSLGAFLDSSKPKSYYVIRFGLFR